MLYDLSNCTPHLCQTCMRCSSEIYCDEWTYTCTLTPFPPQIFHQIWIVGWNPWPQMHGNHATTLWSRLYDLSNCIEHTCQIWCLSRVTCPWSPGCPAHSTILLQGCLFWNPGFSDESPCLMHWSFFAFEQLTENYVSHCLCSHHYSHLKYKFDLLVGLILALKWGWYRRPRGQLLVPGTRSLWSISRKRLDWSICF